MKRYSTEYKHGRCIIKEFNWSYIKDANRPYAYSDIGDAAEEMGYINELIDSYRSVEECAL